MAARGSAAPCHVPGKRNDGNSDDKLDQDHGSEQDAAQRMRVCPQSASRAHAYASPRARSPTALLGANLFFSSCMHTPGA